MSHYAEVVDGIVVNVIVAEEDFIKTLPGKWVQTSYNTRGGIHYGINGEPDGGIPLRKNFASIGYIYNETLDAFYPPSPGKDYRLDTKTCTWIYVPEVTELPYGIINRENTIKLSSTEEEIPDITF